MAFGHFILFRVWVDRSTVRFGVDWPIWRRLADLTSTGRFGVDWLRRPLKKGLACPSRKNKLKFSAFWTRSIFRRFFGKKIVFAISPRFWATHGQTDLIMSFYVKFCFRWTYSEVCATKNRIKVIGIIQYMI